MHRDEQRCGADVVVRGVVGQVGDAYAGADERGLVAHRVDAAQRLGPGVRPGVADVELEGPGRRHGRAVRRGEHQVDADDLVPGLLELAADRGADEAGRAGQQHPHEPLDPGHLVGQVDAVGPRRARAARRVRERLDGGGEDAGEPVEVLPEEGEDVFLADARARLGTGVHVGHQREWRVALPHLPGELRLGGAGHVDEVPALRGVVLRLGAGREARPLDDDHRAARPDVGVGAGEGRRDAGAVGIGERQVHRTRLDVRPDPAVGAVDQLVRDDQVARCDSVPEAADRARRQHLAYAERAQGPRVRAVGDGVRREVVVRAVPRHEGDPPTGHLADRDRRRRVAVRRLDHVLGRVGEERVEAGAADDGDVGLRGVGHPPKLADPAGESCRVGSEFSEP